MNDRTGFLSGDLLLAVEKPTRYTGGEVNAVRREVVGGDLSFLLAFPDAYEVGMSHLGLQILYAHLNGLPGVLCERVFTPWPDMERELRQRRLPLRSLETQRPLKAFDVIGFSLQYELSYTNVLLMLELGEIPLRREARGEDHPLVIAGGPCAFNPAPMSPFIDAFVIGEGEEAVGEIARVLLPLQRRGARRQERLEALASLAGLYVPALHRGSERIAKRIVTDLDAWRHPSCPIVPLMKTIHDRVTLEIARGCTRGCRFCQAGMVWRPVRERTPAVLEEMAEAMLRATGHNELSLLSLSSGDYSLIEPLLTTMMNRYYARRIALALPSLRVETLTPKLIEAIRRVRKTSFTLAPEAGTQRLRDVINKGNTEADLMATTERIFAAGWKAVKLYFMLGLPTERQEDLEGIAELAYQTLRTAKNRGQVTVSLSTFVPKPHTPFQWQPQIGIAETAAAQAFFRQRLKNRNIAVKWHDARMSHLEGILSRGGEETGPLIEAAFELGCRFDGWSDRFRFDLWEEAMHRTGIAPEAYLRERPPTETFPWERIDCGVGRDFLLAEARRAEKGEATPDCRQDTCQQCGVCDQQTIRVVTAPPDAPVGGPLSRTAPGEAGGGPERELRIRFTKLGPARFLSHLELSAALIRALTLSGIAFVYSQGFHPHPKISFAGATAVGTESLAEFADIRVQGPLDGAAPLAARITAKLPAGVEITGICELPPQASSLAEMVRGFDYDLLLPEDFADAALAAIDTAIRDFLAADSFTVDRSREGKPAVRDIRPLVTDLTLEREGRRIRLRARCGAAGTIRPAEFLTAALGLSAAAVRDVRIIKIGVHLPAEANPEERRFFPPPDHKFY
jgi:radical SAM family uncharacterized protein/radical SAM-linked protein